MKRDQVLLRTPVHITIKLARGISGLRSAKIFKEFKRAMKASRLHGLFVVHFSVMHNHVHIIAEVQGNKHLGSGMRSFGGRFSRVVRRHRQHLIKKGESAFRGRYHLHVLETPDETRRAIQYVLLNSQKHGDFGQIIDPFSSAPGFKGWERLIEKKFLRSIKHELEGFRWNRIADELSGVLSEPRSWLCRVGWMRARAAS